MHVPGHNISDTETEWHLPDLISLFSDMSAAVLRLTVPAPPELQA
jgi:hypothetical protein